MLLFPFGRLKCQNWQMASRQFLKILQSARLGDVSAQQSLASAYLTGAFNTPIQPANALIWLEKAYFRITNQSISKLSSDSGFSVLNLDSLRPLFTQLSSVPLASTFNTPGFEFGWCGTWVLAQDRMGAPAAVVDDARWQLIQVVLAPEYADTASRLDAWLDSHSAEMRSLLPANDLTSLQGICQGYLRALASNENAHTQSAKELLLRLQPKDETLAGLWSQWLDSGNQTALINAAEAGFTRARLALGLQLAQLEDIDSVSSAASIAQGSATRSNASLKKAVYWLELAAKDGNRDAWFALGELYRRPQFSGYSASESDRCFDRAADLGHALAQFRKGANLWRKREKLDERVKGLQASYWIWQAQQQKVHEASDLLSKILESCPKPAANDWHDLALRAEQAINRHAEYKIEHEWLLLCHRLVVANQFHFSKAELLLADITQLQHEHCVVVDIRWELPKILPRLIQIETIGQRRALLAAGKVFTGNSGGELGIASPARDSITPNVAEDEEELLESREREGNLRQRRYRFEKVSQWLVSTFAMETTAASRKKGARLK
jgi:TPR repeat protein